MSDVVVIDAGGDNIASVLYALQRIGCTPELTVDPDRIAAAERVILPGVGTAAKVMQRLCATGLVDVVRSLAQPLLGICVGMQVLFEHSEEGDVGGLGLLPGRVRRLAAAPGVRVPHIGWNRLQRQRSSVLLDGIGAHASVYFVHGFAASVGVDCIASCTHGEQFAALVQRGNICGAQFHPERSADAGARLLENFLRWT